MGSTALGDGAYDYLIVTSWDDPQQWKLNQIKKLFPEARVDYGCRQPLMEFLQQHTAEPSKRD